MPEFNLTHTGCPTTLFRKACGVPACKSPFSWSVIVRGHDADEVRSEIFNDGTPNPYGTPSQQKQGRLRKSTSIFKSVQYTMEDIECIPHIETGVNM
jgi:hypothetical protein